VAAPPTLAGSRVLVPLYRVQGRIDYHVACFDLATGARLWATSLISGQIAMNMFNQHSREFCAAPLVVEGQRVIAQTNLGVLAALDLASGEILWQLPIESVPIPRLGHDWMPREREQYWRNAPPIVHGSVVLSAPTDGFDLVAADLATGRPLWSAPQALFLPSERAWPATALRLVGVLEGRIFVAGPVLAFARSSSDLRAVPRADSARGMSAELVADGSFDPNFLAWPALLGRQVVVATPWARVVLDAQDLKNELRALGRDWNEEQGGGNLLASGDWLLSLSNKFVWGAFDWESRERVLRDRLQQLAHSEAKFTDGSVLVDLVNWTLARGENALQQAEPSAALTYAHSARRDLEGPLAQALAPERRTELQGSVEWLSARACAAQADSQAALTHARRALALAATPRERARALVLEAELRRLRNDWPALEGVAAELAQLEFATPLPREGAGRSLGEWRAELELELAGRRGDLTREFELLHELLERAGDVRLRGAEAVFLPASGGPGLEGSRVSERVAELLARGAQARAAHAPIEARAERALAEAMESEDERALERVAERFPHSLAGATALRSRLAQAEAGGDLELVIRLVQRSLAPELAWPSAGEADWEALAALARAAGRAGNLELEAAGERRSQRRGKHDGVGGRTAPGEPDDAGPGRALAQEPRSEFGPELEPLPAYLGEGEVLAGVGAREEQGELLVWIQGRPGEQWVEARFPGAGQQEERTLWRCELPGGFVLDSSAREGRRLILSGGTNLGALDLFTGELRWMLDLAPNQVLRSELRSGVAAALLLTPDGSLALSAFEAVSGLLLWSRPLPGRTLATFAGGPEHVLCFMEEAGVSYLLALDRFAGRRCAQVKLAVRPMEADARGAWIEGSWAFLPSFQRSSAASERARPILRCLDLDAGEETWSLGGDAQRELDAFVRADGRLYAVLRPVSPPAAGEGPQDRGALWEVDLRSGTARELGGAGLGRFEQVLGVPARSVALLEEPFLVLAQVEPRGLRADLRALHLPFGERWRFARSERPRGSTAGSEGPFLPGPSAPAVSSTMVALCVGTEGAEGGAAAIELYERDSGRLKQRLSLPAFLGPSEGIRISGRGRSLIVEGGGQVVVYKSQ
jgi:outer membrane protein assembly factor BamB